MYAYVPLYNVISRALFQIFRIDNNPCKKCVIYKYRVLKKLVVTGENVLPMWHTFSLFYDTVCDEFRFLFYPLVERFYTMFIIKDYILEFVVYIHYQWAILDHSILLLFLFNNNCDRESPCLWENGFKMYTRLSKRRFEKCQQICCEQRKLYFKSSLELINLVWGWNLEDSKVYWVGWSLHPPVSRFS